ncbi:methyltransferase domain-containing protein [Streptomyces sp. NEAU-Y11]|uniref:methyltransferase domain-containing protein n=1 Tax=Streptomyces cucumeris TaxID=2962890 RepID=UPI0020C8EF73|nr:methyltransferase domain-containing protein [Streptomyces sp. NEAU-Y11]MCP9206191.1 methyltransferase [Streptomyces sp. NEAU-Y11]
MVNDGAERTAMRGLLGTLKETLSGVLAPEWERAFWAAPRHAFLPEKVWVGDGLAACVRSADPSAWLHAAYADGPVVTQINDGTDPGSGDRWPSSSASAPSIVFRMLDMLSVANGHRVLEIGTGTGWNAGLLAHRLGAGLVTTVEVDPALAAQAAAGLTAAGLEPRVVTDDGVAGYAAGAPYDRVIATCSVRQVPRAWVKQTKPGGVILTPWESPWFCYGLLRLTVDGQGMASGWFSPHSAFMLMRNQRTDLRIYRDVVRDEHVPSESVTRLSPWEVTGDEWAAQFAVGLQLRDLWRAWHDNPDVEGVTSRLWLATTDAESWAAVDWDGRSDDQFTVWEHGSRRLWGSVEAAYAWWRAMGSPGPDRFGMTITPEGQHTAWLDSPDQPVPDLS